MRGRIQSRATSSTSLALQLTQVAQTPVVHRKVPVPPVRFDCARVPPILVEEAVAEASELGEQVEPQMKVEVKDEEPHVRIGDGQLDDSLDELGNVLVLKRLHGTPERRHNVLLHGKEKQPGDDADAKQEGEHVRPAGVRRQGIVELVRESGRDAKPEEIGQIDVLPIAQKGRLEVLDTVFDFRK